MARGDACAILASEPRVDAVVLSGEFIDRDYELILHTIRDADLNMNTDTDFGARIRELFATIEVVTV